MNLYLMVGNNGVNLVDWLGLIPPCIDCEDIHLRCLAAADAANAAAVMIINEDFDIVQKEIDSQVKASIARCSTGVTGIPCRALARAKATSATEINDAYRAARITGLKPVFAAAIAKCIADYIACSAARAILKAQCKCE